MLTFHNRERKLKMLVVEPTNKTDLDTPATDPTSTRRRFLRWGIYAMAAGVTGVVAVPTIGYFIAPATNSTGLQKVRASVGKVADLANQLEFKAVTLENIAYVDGFKPATVSKLVYVRTLKPDATTTNDFLVLNSTCTHAGCAVPYKRAEKRFVCPCHNSIFDLEGNNISGPAPRPLARYQLTIENGEIMIDPLVEARVG